MSSRQTPLDAAGFLFSCPHIGLDEDPTTHLAFPNPANLCHRATPPDDIDLAYQAHRCLRDFKACPVYQAEAWQGALPPEIRAKRIVRTQRRRAQQVSRRERQSAGRLIWPVIGLVVTALVVLGVIFFSGQLDGGFNGTNIQPTPAITNTDEPVSLPPTATDDEPPTQEDVPTDIPEPTNSPEVEVSDTPLATPIDAPNATIEFGSNLREGPGTGFGIIQYLNPGEQVYLLGRDVPGLWVYIQTVNPIEGQVREGWIAIQQFEVIPDVNALPYGPGIVLPEDASDATPTP